MEAERSTRSKHRLTIIANHRYRDAQHLINRNERRSANAGVKGGLFTKIQEHSFATVKINETRVHEEKYTGGRKESAFTAAARKLIRALNPGLTSIRQW